MFHVRKGVLAVTDTGLVRVWDAATGIMECENTLAVDGLDK